jgi:RNA polymerase sigma-70 factor (ECF subfamily)
MLGSTSEAEDAVQEAWLRLSRTDPDAVVNLGGWLTTVVARVCLDQLRARRVHVQLEDDNWLPDAVVQMDDGPEEQATLADSVGVALLIVLETLTPAERLAFVLHDMFGIPFAEIGEILERSPDAARQLASRARRRVRGTPTITEPDLAQQRRLVSAFLAASREGDFNGLVAVLDPDVVFRVRGRAYTDDVHGAGHVARRVLERGTPLAPRGRPALINGAAGILVGAREHPIAVAAFTVADGKITSIDVILSPTLVD